VKGMDGRDRRKGGDPVCPKCGGSGRIGQNRAICRTCWLAGVIPAWLEDELNREAGRLAENSDGEESDDVGATARVAALIDCTKCDITTRCARCPWGPFRLVADLSGETPPDTELAPTAGSTCST
jgi:hypothetical protein